MILESAERYEDAVDLPEGGIMSSGTDNDDFDLVAYFKRIGFSGPAAPDLKTLRTIHVLHPAAIPFENLDPLLDRPVKLDLASLQDKLVGHKRGGYCFEQNALLMAALKAVGFDVTSLIARVRWMSAPESPPTPRTHMLLRVKLDGQDYLCDVGFGGHILMMPLRLDPGIEQETPAGVLRLNQDGDFFTLQTKLLDIWRDCYRFTLEPAFAADYAVSNWYTSTHPASLFRNNLLAERLTPHARIGLFNRQLTLRHADGRVEQRVIETKEALADILEGLLGLAPPADAADIFARLPKE